MILARDERTKTPELRAALSLDYLYRAQGRNGEAGDVLSPVYGWFTQGFDTPDLTDAKEFLEQLQ
jgi:predicted ATPase